MKDSTSTNKRIAKNTFALYIRTGLVMCVSLFTSRIILRSLGVVDYGIYNVVGGIVSMFSVVSSSLSLSISRFITVALGKNDIQKQQTIFCTSINIQLIFAVVVVFGAEILGSWFLNTKLNIPQDRLYAANWVFQFSIVAFIINLLSIPYNALIIAHERMSAFAYISILDVILKLLVAYVIYIVPIDKLIVYSFLLVVVSFLIRFSYSIYCKKHFQECRYQFILDKELLKRMSRFAGWNFIVNIVWVLNSLGINFLINIYFGTVVNAARGIVAQIENAVKKFVTDFSTAINPQIMKACASGEYERMHLLVCRSAKYLYFLVLLFAFPIILETDFILRCWLGIVPEHTVAFTRLALVVLALDFLGNSLYIGCQATGKIKLYTIVSTLIQSFVFPFVWGLYRIGLPVESFYYLMIVMFIIVLFAKIILSQMIFNLPYQMFCSEVVLRIIPVTLLSSIAPLLVKQNINAGIGGFVCVTITSVLSFLFFVYYVGFLENEKKMFVNFLSMKFFHFFRR